MAREGSLLAYSAEEARAMSEEYEEREAFNRALKALDDLVSDRAAARPTIAALELHAGAIAVITVQVLHARLVRVLPHLADVLTFLCFSEGMETPEFLDVTGRPKPVSNVANPYRDVNA